MGSGVVNFGNEVAAKKVAKVYAIESVRLEPYTPDGFAAVSSSSRIAAAEARPDAAHLSGARFVPKLATAMGRTAISDCIGYKKDGGKLLFTRQMFQGKLAADVSFSCHAPWFVTFQNGAFRGDKAEAGASRCSD